jgi:hypothetical protein
MKKHLVFGFDPTGVVMDATGEPVLVEQPIDLSQYWCYDDPDPRSNAGKVFEGLWRFKARNKVNPTELRAHPSSLIGVDFESFRVPAPGQDESAFMPFVVVPDDRCEPGKLYIRGQ